MKKSITAVYILTVLFSSLFSSCKKAEEPTPYFNDSYKPLEGTIWCDESGWYYGYISFFVFNDNNTFEWRMYKNAEGCDYTNKSTSYFKYFNSDTGYYIRNEDEKEFISYNLYLDNWEQYKIRLFYNNLGNNYQLEIGYDQEELPFPYYQVTPILKLSNSDYIDINGNPYTKGTSGGGGGTSDPTASYTITPVSVCAIYMLDNKNTGEKYTKSYYKWVSSTGKVILSISATNSAYWIGVASKNNDSTRGGYPVSGYTYRYIDYTPVGGAWYYYFN